MEVSTSLQRSSWSPTIATTRSMGKAGGTARAAVTGICPPSPIGASTAATRNCFIIVDLYPAIQLWFDHFLPPGEVDDAAEGADGGSAGFNGTAVGGCWAVCAESAELRILAASCTARSNPASLNEYLYFSLRILESGVGTDTNVACS